ncbi:hypothetical protein MesoLj131c_70480 (plasmid) [Mesorhizobium sp. 131-3-5]|nr:hypothetical protein MesoLj131c_70480 [Mesorhizobium sp. 131-3-5]
MEIYWIAPDRAAQPPPADARSGAGVAAGSTGLRHFYFAGGATFELGCNITSVS